MAKSRYEYVKQFERVNVLLPETHVIIRVDGKGFHRFSDRYNFDKPNDAKALNVMNMCANELMQKFPDIMMAYGDSDEYSFLLRKSFELFGRREFKLVTTFSASMSAYYQYFWNKEFPDRPLDIERLPTFDARAVMYPTDEVLKDYFRWRQVDCHINNLYNTTFWSLVLKGGLTPHDAEAKLVGTVSSDKNEILFKEFGINYNNEPELYKKGTTFIRDFEGQQIPNMDGNSLTKGQLDRLHKKLKKSAIRQLHCDIIQDAFWTAHSWLLL